MVSQQRPINQFPQLHRTVRCVYDALGPAMASKPRSPYIADFAYLLLKLFKLFEGTMWVGLSVLAPNSEAHSKKMYGSSDDTVHTNHIAQL